MLAARGYGKGVNVLMQADQNFKKCVLTERLESEGRPTSGKGVVYRLLSNPGIHHHHYNSPPLDQTEFASPYIRPHNLHPEDPIYYYSPIYALLSEWHCSQKQHKYRKHFIKY
jgi:hypothetical protein